MVTYDYIWLHVSTYDYMWVHMITGEYKCQHLGLPEVKKMIFLLNFVIQPRIFEICALVMYACSQYMLQASINLRRLTKSVPLA